jgi:hypothetical protein
VLKPLADIEAGEENVCILAYLDNDQDPDETDMNPFRGNWCNYVFNTRIMGTRLITRLKPISYEQLLCGFENIGRKKTSRTSLISKFSQANMYEILYVICASICTACPPRWK